MACAPQTNIHGVTLHDSDVFLFAIVTAFAFFILTVSFRFTIFCIAYVLFVVGFLMPVARTSLKCKLLVTLE